MNKKLPEYLGRKRLYNKNYKNHKNNVILWEVLEIQKRQRLLVKFISTNSIHRQGIRIAIDAGDGKLIINGVQRRSFDLWEDEGIDGISVECYSEEGYLSIYNIFERLEGWGKGRNSQMPYSGMILEQHGNIYQYKCNDTGNNTDFDKLIFEVELL